MMDTETPCRFVFQVKSLDVVVKFSVRPFNTSILRRLCFNNSGFLARERFDSDDHGSTTPPPPIGHPPALTRMTTVGNIPQNTFEQFEFVSRLRQNCHTTHMLKYR